MTVAQLKEELKSRELPVSGVKAKLIERLREHEDQGVGGDAVAATQKTPSAVQTKTRKRIFPPPNDETEVQVTEKEVQETVQLLDSLKLSGNSKRQQKKNSLSSTPRKLSRQQRTEMDLMESLKRSLKQTQSNSQQPKDAIADKNEEASASSDNTLTKGQPLLSPDEQSTHSEKMEYYVKQLRLKPANDLKEELSKLRLSVKGRKPDLVTRLAEHFVANGFNDNDGEDDEDAELELPTLTRSTSLDLDVPMSFAGIPRLSSCAANALHQAFGNDGESELKPTPIQSVTIPKLYYPPNQSALLHAPTGSGKSIAFLLPITETLWREVEGFTEGNVGDPSDMENGVALVLLPTRELAAQVAGVASVLAPPGMVKLIPRPMDVMSCWKDEVDRGEEYEYYKKNSGGDVDAIGAEKGRKYQPRILVGSAKSIFTSLFGSAKLPGTPTSKPQGKALLRNTRWLVMDEVDRLLNVKTSRTDKKSKRHEKPAAMLAAAISRLTVGRVQVIAASATVGRPLRRELSRVLGLHSSECPETLRGEADAETLNRELRDDEKHVGRAVKIPQTVRNYVLPVDGSTSGSLLTSGAFAAKALLQSADDFEVSNRKVLLVLTRNCGIKVNDAMGALRHFGIRPEPQSLLDALEADGTDRLVEAHRKVSGVEGVGGAKKQQSMEGNTAEGGGYLLVTHEDNVRGLHLDALDAVIVVGRPGSPDEYTHIAGRTGRAGRNGSVLNIVGYEQAAALASWTKMLGVDFFPVDESEVARI